jgi:serine/threonine protein phosphatase PrpC
MSSSKRHFTAVIGKKEQGSYASSSPSSAARKAVSKLCADDKNKKVEFYMRETTQGSDKKVYGMYIGYVEKLKKPIELKGRVIRYKPVAKLLKNKKMKGGVPNELVIQIPGNNNQDIVLTGVNYVIICDGHGATPEGNGRAIAQEVADKCTQLIPPEIEVNEGNLELLKNRFIEMVLANFEDWRDKYPEAGTTVLIVVFSPDYQSYMVVKLGDSYVLQIPRGFQENASAYAFNSIQVRNQTKIGLSYPGQIHYKPSMSSYQILYGKNFNGMSKYKSEPIKQRFQELFGARILPKGDRFHKNINNNKTIGTLSIDPPFFKPKDDIKKFLENFTKCGIFQRDPEKLLIIASDGLPIENGRIWSIIHSQPALGEYFSKIQNHDDFTVVIIQ